MAGALLLVWDQSGLHRKFYVSQVYKILFQKTFKNVRYIYNLKTSTKYIYDIREASEINLNIFYLTFIYLFIYLGGVGGYACEGQQTRIGSLFPVGSWKRNSGHQA